MSALSILFVVCFVAYWLDRNAERRDAALRQYLHEQRNGPFDD